MAKPSRELQLLIQSSLDLFEESEQLARFSVDVLGEIRDRVTASIVRASDSDLSSSLTVQGQYQILEEVDRHLAAGIKSLQTHAKDTWLSLYESQFRAVTSEIVALGKAIPASGLTGEELGFVSSLKPRLSGNLIKASMEASLDKITRVPVEIKTALRREIAIGVLSGDSYGTLTRKIQGTGLDKGVFKTVEARAQVIAITETTNIYNASRYESIVATNRGLPQDKRIQYKWLALLDKRTSTRCRSLHGQVRPQGEDFVASDGWRGKMPAAHPNCRSQIVAFRAAWQEVFDELEAAISEGDSQFV